MKPIFQSLFGDIRVINIECVEISNERMVSSLKMFVLWFLFNLCVGIQPADKGANAKTKQTLDYIAGLPGQGSHVLIDCYF